MAISRLIISLTALSVVLPALSGTALAAPTTRTGDRDGGPFTTSLTAASTAEDVSAADAAAPPDASAHAHRRRRHRRSSVAGGRHHADVDALRRLLFGLRPLHDDDVDFGGLEVRDLLRGRENGGVAAVTRDVVLLPLTGYDDEPDDGADDAVLSAIVTAPRRSRCPPGERYYERRCRKVWRTM